MTGWLVTIAAEIAKSRNPDDPADKISDGYQIELKPILSVTEQNRLWDLPQIWCRRNVDHAAGNQWSRRIGPSRRPIYTFTCIEEAVEFKLLFA